MARNKRKPREPWPLDRYPIAFFAIAAQGRGSLALADLPWAFTSMRNRWYDFVSAIKAHTQHPLNEKVRGLKWRIALKGPWIIIHSEPSALRILEDAQRIDMASHID